MIDVYTRALFHFTLCEKKSCVGIFRCPVSATRLSLWQSMAIASEEKTLIETEVARWSAMVEKARIPKI